MLLRVAFATNNGESFNINRHFGDADFSDIKKNNVEFVSRLESTIEAEDHAAPKKAKSIGKMLIEHKVNITASIVYSI